MHKSEPWCRFDYDASRASKRGQYPPLRGRARYFVQLKTSIVFLKHLLSQVESQLLCKTEQCKPETKQVQVALEGQLSYARTDSIAETYRTPKTRKNAREYK